MLVPTIGMEVHVELKSKTKVFSDSLNDFSSSVNSNVNEIDLGYPGVLPKLNKEVVLMALKAALALNCKINKVMHFDRKNYFYPDLPKGYQITQNDTPIGYDGYINVEVDGMVKKIEIERIHIEEDTCKCIHSLNGTLINYNRAGVPLIEIVTKPVIKDAKTAVAYLEALREILLYIGVSDVKMEEGSMRCEANVSLSEEMSEVLGVKTEIKNIGSISNVKTSIEYEIKRQTDIINSGGKVISETRRFDDKTSTTISMRVKESGNDYRYLPEPDIPYLVLDDSTIEEVKTNMPLLPNQLRKKYRDLGINENCIRTLISEYDLSNFLSNLENDVNPIIAANLLTGDVLAYINKNKLKLEDTKLDTNNFSNLVKKLNNGKISSKQAKEILNILIVNGGNVDEIISSLGFEQISNENELIDIINKVLRNNEESINDYKNGKDRAIKYLIGQIMKETKGQANPISVNKLLIDMLKKY